MLTMLREAWDVVQQRSLLSAGNRVSCQLAAVSRGCTGDPGGVVSEPAPGAKLGSVERTVYVSNGYKLLHSFVASSRAHQRVSGFSTRGQGVGGGLLLRGTRNALAHAGSL